MYQLIYRTIFICAMALLPAVKAGAQAYVYIQSDKHTPFYLKVNGVMQQRYSKYYCIAPRLQPGKTDVEILFQQNAWPAQQFTIDVPASGKCGFILSRDGDNFYLYDPETKNKITPLKEDKK